MEAFVAPFVNFANENCNKFSLEFFKSNDSKFLLDLFFTSMTDLKNLLKKAV
jgi:hypothetical protein